LILRAVVANSAAVSLARLLLALLALSAVACGKSIGDDCTTSVDCSQDGNRDCDLSQPGGYCTINGCDEKFCPSESVCIRVFPYEAQGTTSCDWLTANQTAAGGGCPADQICLPDGICVPRVTERRFCEKSCGSNSDCRSGYVCREAGVEGKQPTSNTYGSIALVANPNQSMVVKFCTAGSQ
jgi:hypothetical protein